MSIDVFASPKSCLARAQENAAELGARIKGFINKKPYALVRELHNDGVSQVHKVKATQSVPLSLAAITADVVGNLRAALDQAGYACAVAAGIAAPTKAHFPFAATPSDLANAVKGRCSELPDEIVKVMINFKPYRGGNDLLWLVNEFCNVNKHRMLCSMGFALNSARMRLVAFFGPGHLPIPPRWDRANNEMIYAVVGPGGKLYRDIEFAFDVAFDEVPIVSAKPVVPVIDQLIDVVRSVLNAIESEAKRTGLC